MQGTKRVDKVTSVRGASNYADRRILKLIRQWLVSGVLYGNVLTISELGTSQGLKSLLRYGLRRKARDV